MTPTQLIPLASIAIPERLRKLNMEHARALAENISEEGLHQAIVVRPSGGPGHEPYVLVIGRHRLEAFTLNKEPAIPAIVETFVQEPDDDEEIIAINARIAEIDENVRRLPLTPGEDKLHTAERMTLANRRSALRRLKAGEAGMAAAQTKMDAAKEAKDNEAAKEAAKEHDAARKQRDRAKVLLDANNAFCTNSVQNNGGGFQLPRTREASAVVKETAHAQGKTVGQVNRGLRDVADLGQELIGKLVGTCLDSDTEHRALAELRTVDPEAFVRVVAQAQAASPTLPRKEQPLASKALTRIDKTKAQYAKQLAVQANPGISEREKLGRIVGHIRAAKTELEQAIKLAQAYKVGAKRNAALDTLTAALERELVAYRLMIEATKAPR